LIRSTEEAGKVGIVNQYMGSDINVTEVSESLFREAVEKGDWWKTPPVPMDPYAEIWMLRSNFHFREDALMDVIETKANLYGPLTTEGIDWIVVRKDQDTEQILQEWCDRGSVEAITSCAKGDNDRAYDNATLAFSICNAPEKCGLYLAVLEETQHPNEYENTIKMLESTQGYPFLIAAMHCKQTALTEIYKQRCAALAKDVSTQEITIRYLTDQNEILLRNCRMGDHLYSETNPLNPGNLLRELGWEYQESDVLGSGWIDPKGGQAIGPPHTLFSAVMIALERLIRSQKS